eukprot:TRINITY_DN3749_c0_g1_i1.p2 TRINITY_DN3749_c0_g1~~TRINITY_DN3749_c0_g1_i1.p2  ORF type:complete len:256 (+),score=93.22 TRINITY_DN3749_c0_g1_i1:52-819(+)
MMQRLALRGARTPALRTLENCPMFKEEWKMSFQEGDKIVSPWHDVPLVAEGGQTFNYLNEIPIHTRAKMEVATKVEGNPIKQDIKKGKLRFFTYGDIPFNYGCLPSTWEDPDVKVPSCNNASGDNDPLDVCEISGVRKEVGEITPVKALGVLAMIDEGETDWKLIALPATEEFARFNTLKDLQADPVYNQKLADIVHWFRYYKTTDGKPENSFGFNSEYQNEDFAMKVIEETHEQYVDLVSGKANNPKNVWTPSL